jgi:hypothetical protein
MIQVPVQPKKRPRTRSPVPVVHEPMIHPFQGSPKSPGQLSGSKDHSEEGLNHRVVGDEAAEWERLQREENKAEEHERTGVYVFPPTTDEAELALADLDAILRPRRAKGPGYVDPELDPLTRRRLEAM